ncbi:MAG TPA: hypothetical protein VGL97_17090 [Bryobacteraceae bacterium]
MRRIAVSVGMLLGLSAMLPAAEIQGVIVDWNCVKAMVRDGRAKVFKQNRTCSLMKNYNRQTYGLITGDKKFYKLDDPGNQHVLELLKNTPDKDNLKVVATGDIQGNTIKVTEMTML